MISIIKSLLTDCNYEYINTAKIEISNIEFSLAIFKGEQVENQIFLVLSMLESQLLNPDISEDLVISVATEFRKSEIYESDMDKNTSLVYCVEMDINSPLLVKRKVEIEDDPYYFKKYVFSYGESDAEKFEQLRKQFGQSPLEFVQGYILDANNFNKFKNNYANESIYKMISDLVIKIPMIPIAFEKKEEIKTITDYMDSIQRCSENEIIMLDKIIEDIVDIEDSDMDLMLNKIFEIWPLNE